MDVAPSVYNFYPSSLSVLSMSAIIKGEPSPVSQLFWSRGGWVKGYTLLGSDKLVYTGPPVLN